MINNVILVGNLACDPIYREVKSGQKKVCDLVLQVAKPFKDSVTGQIENELIKVTLWNAISKTAYEYCQKGDTVGIKGRLSDRIEEVDGVNHHNIQVIGERLILINLKINKEPVFRDDNKINKAKKVSKKDENLDIIEDDGFEDLPEDFD